MTDDDKVTRSTYPTAAFTIRQSHIRWIALAAKREGISKSAYVRRIFDRAMADDRERAA